MTLLSNKFIFIIKLASEMDSYQVEYEEEQCIGRGNFGIIVYT